MKKILFVESSPRKERSITTEICHQLIEKLNCAHDYEIDVLDLWREELPHMNGTNLAAKYAIFEGSALTAEQQRHWDMINDHVQRFASADLVVIAAPTWNWGIPYVLKHYVDVVTQPGLSFTWAPDTGYTSMLPTKRAFIVSSSGGDYTKGSGNEHEDFAIKYLELWLSSCMGCEVDIISMTMTALGQGAVDAARRNALTKIESIFESMVLQEV